MKLMGWESGRDKSKLENGEIVEYNAWDSEGTRSTCLKIKVFGHAPGRPTSV